jgi:Excreted virulence factor EspC, type VII ESX diderm
MSGNLFVQTDGLRNFSQTHADIAAGLSQLTGVAATGVETSHGPIAAAVSAALGDVLGARDGTIQTIANSGSTISDLLQKAAQMYQQGDEKGAATLKAAGAPLQALAQPLQQLPQQVMQGVQQASKAGEKTGVDPTAPGDSKAPGQDTRAPGADEPADRAEPKHRAEPAQRAEAAPGDSVNTGRAPDLPQAGRAEPAQTRPQSD